MIDARDPVWNEYDSAAEWCAKRGLKGEPGDELPDALSVKCFWIINDDPEAFALRIRETAYALSRGEHDEQETI